MRKVYKGSIAVFFMNEQERKERKKRMASLTRENNKLARELGYARGVKQMIEEGVLK
jgi:cell division protein FtsB